MLNDGESSNLSLSAPLTKESTLIEELIEVITDPAHLIAEFMFEGIFFVLGMAYTRYTLRRRDKEHNHA